MYIDKLGDIFKTYNKAYHRTVKMEPADVKLKKYINFNDYKDPKFKVVVYVRISKYKKDFAKDYVPNWSEEAFLIKKVENTVPWAFFVNDINGQETIGFFLRKRVTKNKWKRIWHRKIN